jgi:DNA-binding GntR family transcriptional regulator
MDKQPGHRPQRGKARHVYAYYAHMIDSGRIKPNERLPIYSEIQEQHGISHATAVTVIRALREDLYLRSTTAGIYVNLAGPDRLLQRLCDVLNEIKDSGLAEDLQVECTLKSGNGVRWNPASGRWERTAP